MGAAEGRVVERVEPRSIAGVRRDQEQLDREQADMLANAEKTENSTIAKRVIKFVDDCHKNADQEAQFVASDLTLREVRRDGTVP